MCKLGCLKKHNTNWCIVKVSVWRCVWKFFQSIAVAQCKKCHHGCSSEMGYWWLEYQSQGPKMKADCLVVPMSNSQSIGNCQEICPGSLFSMIPQCGKLIVCRSRTIWESENLHTFILKQMPYSLYTTVRCMSPRKSHWKACMAPQVNPNKWKTLTLRCLQLTWSCI